MKKLLALVLSLIMITTSVFIVPLSAQADKSGNTTLIYLYRVRKMCHLKISSYQIIIGSMIYDIIK